jgi:hypothetical protein
MFDGVSTNGTSSFLIQLGDSGGIETTGYNSGSVYTSTATNNASSTAGVLIHTFGQNTTIYGQMTFSLFDTTTNTWAATGNFSSPSGSLSFYSSGTKALSASLDRVRITTVIGTNTFDAGSINILYE